MESDRVNLKDEKRWPNSFEMAVNLVNNKVKEKILIQGLLMVFWLADFLYSTNKKLPSLLLLSRAQLNT
jgi:hypothetical protein